MSIKIALYLRKEEDKFHQQKINDKLCRDQEGEKLGILCRKANVI